jgi:hypothetical protein
MCTGSNSMETSYSMQDELQHVLSVLYADKGKHLDIHKTPEVYIDQRSTAKYVPWIRKVTILYKFIKFSYIIL